MDTRGAIEEQDGAKRGQEEPRVRPRWVKMGPRWPKMSPRGPQDDPKRPLEDPKKHPREPNGSPKASKMDQDGPKECPKAQNERKSEKLKIIEKPIVFIAFLKSWGSQMGSCWAQDGSVEVQVASC